MPGDDASDDAPSDSSFYDNGCVTRVDGGTVLFGFDNGDINGWFSDPMSLPAGAISGTEADGVTCMGALSLTVPFTAYSQQSLVDFNWGSSTPLPWAGSKLHFSVKIVAATPGAYQGLLLVQPMMLWNGWASGDYTMFQYVNPTLADGQWHEVVMDITEGSAPFSEAVDGFRFLVMDQQLAADGGPPDAGPPTPSSAQYLFDDVWLE